MQDQATELRTFFDEYVDRFNDALETPSDRALLKDIAAQYTSTFMAAGPQGVSAGANDASFIETLEQGYQQYAAIGTRRMSVRGVDVTPIDEQHAMARVAFHASYVRPGDGVPVEIDFDVTYLLEKQERWRVFAFIAGDEEALYREYGLMPS